jgi:hypothetical protein
MVFRRVRGNASGRVAGESRIGAHPVAGESQRLLIPLLDDVSSEPRPIAEAMAKGAREKKRAGQQDRHRLRRWLDRKPIDRS